MLNSTYIRDNPLSKRNRHEMTRNDMYPNATKCENELFISFFTQKKWIWMSLKFHISYQREQWISEHFFFSVSLMNTPDYSRKMLHGRTVPMLLFLGLKGFDEQKIYNCFVMNMCLLIRAENWHQCDKDYMTQTTKPK